MRQKERQIIAIGKDGLFLEILIYHNKILIFERNGQGQIEKFTERLSQIGLNLVEEFNSPCG